MKLFMYLCIFALVALSAAAAVHSRVRRQCILGRCTPCPDGEYIYTTGCGFKKPEATCDQPNPVEDTRGHLCDYSACYCNAPTVRDTTTKKCVSVEQCPKKE